MPYTSVKIVLRKNFKRSDGTRSVCLQFLQNRRPYLISLGISVKESQWDQTRNRIKGSSDEIQKLNQRIYQLNNKANSIILDMQLAGQIVTYDRFRTAFLDKNYGNASLFTYIEQQIELYQGKFAPSTLKSYKDQMNKLKLFRRSISFVDVDTYFLKLYTRWMINERGNSENYVKRSLKFIKQIVNKAFQDGLINENPVKDFPVGEIKGNREFLTMEELNKLETFMRNGVISTAQKKVLEYFLFDCYTGLRYGDLERLQFKHLTLEAIEPFLRIKTQKTGETITIPLIARAMALIPKQEFENQVVFNMLTGQATNRSLSKIMKKAGIKKHITNHCARHTFGACGIQHGIPIEVLKKLMGHSHIETTEIYARIQDDVKFKEMGKWDK